MQQQNQLTIVCPGCPSRFASVAEYASHRRTTCPATRPASSGNVYIGDCNPNSPQPEMPTDATPFVRAIWEDFLETRAKVQRDWDKRHERIPRHEPPASRSTRVARPRRARSRAAAKHSATARGPDGDREPPPQRICAGCDEEFTPRRRDQLTHDEVCRQRACRKRILVQRLALELVHQGEISGEDALALVIQPTKMVLDALRARTTQVAA